MSKFAVDSLDGFTFVAAPPPNPMIGRTNAAAVDEFINLMGGEHIWHDAGGWPLAISRGWFRRQDGQLVQADGITPAELAMTLRDAHIIGWHWQKAADGSAQMVRRYIARVGVRTLAVDISRSGWSAQTVTGDDADGTKLLSAIRP